MKNITELYDSYLAKEREERCINERIIDRELQIARLEKKKIQARRLARKSCYSPCENFNPLTRMRNVRNSRSVWTSRRNVYLV